MKFETAKTKYGDMLFYTTEEKLERYKAHFENDTWESAVAELVNTLDYEMFVDVGSGFGYYSMMAASRSPYTTVYGFEPHPIRNGIAQWNLRRYPNAYAYCKAVGAIPYFDLDNPVDFGYAYGGGYDELISNFISISLDDIVSPVFKTLIKIDVEGLEVDVIESIGTVESYPLATWIVEYHNNWKHLNVSEDDILKLFPEKYYIREKIGNRNHWMFRSRL